MQPGGTQQTFWRSVSVLLPKSSMKQAPSRANLLDGVLIGFLFNPKNYCEMRVNFSTLHIVYSERRSLHIHRWGNLKSCKWMEVHVGSSDVIISHQHHCHSHEMSRLCCYSVVGINTVFWLLLRCVGCNNHLTLVSRIMCQMADTFSCQLFSFWFSWWGGWIISAHTLSLSF
jgi:hypothetical protein